MSIYVPPGGFAGYAQQVPAAQAGQAGGRISRGGGARRRKRKGTKKAASAKKRGGARGTRRMLNGRRMTAKQAKYFGKRKKRR